ncbi:MAG: GntR family transcriptional regulator [Chloroflexi bacterium]|nr:GntR family transcriptional regulator [Chloroflexota bacterium]
MAELNLQQIENKPLREKIVDVLRDMLISGELKPGQPLVESKIASQMGVSRVPVREAIQALSSEGLVEITPYRGAVVRRLTRRDIEELYSLRAVLESFAIQRIVACPSADVVDRLTKCFEDMLSAARANELNRVNQIDREFHDTLIELADHNLLSLTWSSVSMRVRQVMALRNRQNADLTQVAYNHQPIIEAIAAKNEEEAIRLIRIHVASSGDLLAEMWDDEGED